MRRIGRAGAAAAAAALAFALAAALPGPEAEGAVELSRGEGTAPAGAVELNSAAQQELDLLPGIGPVKAAAIIDYRAEHGPFSDVQELLEVPGIGEATLEGLRDYVCADAQEEYP